MHTERKIAHLWLSRTAKGGVVLSIERIESFIETGAETYSCKPS